jgi:oxygen-independent coproporphyrinogen-3 oxidase
MFHVAHDAEVTMEMDPGTFTLDDLIKWKELLGLNRISLGVQALNDPVLEQLGRFHRVKDIYHAVDAIQRAGIDNYSIDLISGLPGVSLVDWAETLEKTIQDLKPVHLSIYDLQIEEGTVFGKWYSSDEASLSFNKPQLPSADDCAYMYKYASGYLRHLGYEHYEISSFAKSDYRSRHNQAYWAYHSQWYAVGLGATSLIQKHSFARPRAMSDYVKWVETQKLRNQPEWLPGKDDEEDDRLTEIVMTRLRTSEGLDLEWLENSFGGSVVESVLQGAQLALELKLAAVNDKCLKLVDPQGFLFSNSILSSIFLEIGLIQ